MNIPNFSPPSEPPKFPEPTPDQLAANARYDQAARERTEANSAMVENSRDDTIAPFAEAMDDLHGTHWLVFEDDRHLGIGVDDLAASVVYLIESLARELHDPEAEYVLRAYIASWCAICSAEVPAEIVADEAEIRDSPYSDEPRGCILQAGHGCDHLTVFGAKWPCDPKERDAARAKWHCP